MHNDKRREPAFAADFLERESRPLESTGQAAPNPGGDDAYASPDEDAYDSVLPLLCLAIDVSTSAISRRRANGTAAKCARATAEEDEEEEEEEVMILTSSDHDAFPSRTQCEPGDSRAHPKPYIQAQRLVAWLQFQKQTLSGEKVQAESGEKNEDEDDANAPTAAFPWLLTFRLCGSIASILVAQDDVVNKNHLNVAKKRNNNIPCTLATVRRQLDVLDTNNANMDVRMRTVRYVAVVDTLIETVQGRFGMVTLANVNNNGHLKACSEKKDACPRTQHMLQSWDEDSSDGGTWDGKIGTPPRWQRILALCWQGQGLAGLVLSGLCMALLSILYISQHDRDVTPTSVAAAATNATVAPSGVVASTAADIPFLGLLAIPIVFAVYFLTVNMAVFLIFGRGRRCHGGSTGHHPSDFVTLSVRNRRIGQQASLSGTSTLRHQRNQRPPTYDIDGSLLINSAEGRHRSRPQHGPPNALVACHPITVSLSNLPTSDHAYNPYRGNPEHGGGGDIDDDEMDTVRISDEISSLPQPVSQGIRHQLSQCHQRLQEDMAALASVVGFVIPRRHGRAKNGCRDHSEDQLENTGVVEEEDEDPMIQDSTLDPSAAAVPVVVDLNGTLLLPCTSEEEPILKMNTARPGGDDATRGVGAPDVSRDRYRSEQALAASTHTRRRCLPPVAVDALFLHAAVGIIGVQIQPPTQANSSAVVCLWNDFMSAETGISRSQAIGASIDSLFTITEAEPVYNALDLRELGNDGRWAAYLRRAAKGGGKTAEIVKLTVKLSVDSQDNEEPAETFHVVVAPAALAGPAESSARSLLLFCTPAGKAAPPIHHSEGAKTVPIDSASSSFFSVTVNRDEGVARRRSEASFGLMCPFAAMLLARGLDAVRDANHQNPAPRPPHGGLSKDVTVLDASSSMTDVAQEEEGTIEQERRHQWTMGNDPLHVLRHCAHAALQLLTRTQNDNRGGRSRKPSESLIQGREPNDKKVKRIYYSLKKARKRFQSKLRGDQLLQSLVVLGDFDEADTAASGRAQLASVSRSPPLIRVHRDSIRACVAIVKKFALIVSENEAAKLCQMRLAIAKDSQVGDSFLLTFAIIESSKSEKYQHAIDLGSKMTALQSYADATLPGACVYVTDYHSSLSACEGDTRPTDNTRLHIHLPFVDVSGAAQGAVSTAPGTVISLPETMSSQRESPVAMVPQPSTSPKKSVIIRRESSDLFQLPHNATTSSRALIESLHHAPCSVAVFSLFSCQRTLLRQLWKRGDAAVCWKGLQLDEDDCRLLREGTRTFDVVIATIPNKANSERWLLSCGLEDDQCERGSSVRLDCDENDADIMDLVRDRVDRCRQICAEFGDTAFIFLHSDDDEASLQSHHNNVAGGFKGMSSLSTSSRPRNWFDVVLPANAFPSFLSGGRSVSNSTSFRLESEAVDVVRLAEYNTHAATILEEVRRAVAVVTAYKEKTFVVEEVLRSHRLPAWERGKRLGSGAFGEVYEAVLTATGGRAAVKILKTSAEVRASHEGSGFSRLELLVREIQILSRLRHPNVVEYLFCEMVDKKKTLHIFMELCEGGSLSARCGVLNAPAVIIGVATQVLEALSYLHSQGIVHRDIKPANLLLSRGRVKVSDFGTAAMVDPDNRSTSGTAGTFPYMAPEVFTGAAYSTACDIWSFGCVMLDLLGIPQATCGAPRSLIGVRFGDCTSDLEIQGLILMAAASLPPYTSHAQMHLGPASSAHNRSGTSSVHASANRRSVASSIRGSSLGLPAQPYSASTTFANTVNAEDIAALQGTTTSSVFASPDGDGAMSEVAAHEAVRALLVQLALECLRLDPSERPTASELMSHAALNAVAQLRRSQLRFSRLAPLLSRIPTASVLQGPDGRPRHPPPQCSPADVLSIDSALDDDDDDDDDEISSSGSPAPVVARADGGGPAGSSGEGPLGAALRPQGAGGHHLGNETSSATDDSSDADGSDSDFDPSPSPVPHPPPRPPDQHDRSRRVHVPALEATTLTSERDLLLTSGTATGSISNHCGSSSNLIGDSTSTSSTAIQSRHTATSGVGGDSSGSHLVGGGSDMPEVSEFSPMVGTTATIPKYSQLFAQQPPPCKYAAGGGPLSASHTAQNVPAGSTDTAAASSAAPLHAGAFIHRRGLSATLPMKPDGTGLSRGPSRRADPTATLGTSNTWVALLALTQTDAIADTAAGTAETSHLSQSSSLANSRSSIIPGGGGVAHTNAEGPLPPSQPQTARPRNPLVVQSPSSRSEHKRGTD